MSTYEQQLEAARKDIERAAAAQTEKETLEELRRARLISPEQIARERAAGMDV